MHRVLPYLTLRFEVVWGSLQKMLKHKTKSKLVLYIFQKDFQSGGMSVSPAFHIVKCLRQFLCVPCQLRTWDSNLHFAITVCWRVGTIILTRLVLSWWITYPSDRKNHSHIYTIYCNKKTYCLIWCFVWCLHRFTPNAISPNGAHWKRYNFHLGLGQFRLRANMVHQATCEVKTSSRLWVICGPLVGRYFTPNNLIATIIKGI